MKAGVSAHATVLYFELHVLAEEIAVRKGRLKAPEPSYDRGVPSKIRKVGKLRLSASRGTVTDG